MDEVKLALDDIGLDLSMDECHALVNRFDNNGVPAIQYEDLVDLLCGGTELQSFAASRSATQFITHPAAALNKMRFDENLTGKVISWAGRQTRRPQNIKDLSATPGTTVYGASCGISESAVFHNYSRQAAEYDSGAVVVGEIGQYSSRDALEKLKRKTIKRFQTTGRNHLAVGTKPKWLAKHPQAAAAATFDQKQRELQRIRTASNQADDLLDLNDSNAVASEGSSIESEPHSCRSYGDGDFKDLLLRLKASQKRDLRRISKHFQPKGHLGKDAGAQEDTLANSIKHKQTMKQQDLGLHRSVLYDGLPLVAAEVMRQEHESSHSLRIASDSGLDVEGLGDDVRWKTTTQLFSEGRALPQQEFDKIAGSQKIRLARDAIDQYEQVIAERERQKKLWDEAEREQRTRMAAKAAALMADAAAKRRRDDLWEHQTRREPNPIHTNPAQRSHSDAFGFGFLPGQRSTS